MELYLACLSLVFYGRSSPGDRCADLHEEFDAAATRVHRPPGYGEKLAMLMMTAWPVLMAAIVVLQAQAMRWMLRKGRWADFRIAILPRNE
ncbi:MAG: hypothetical protein WCB10_04745 [Steroidobacteraceae bacterium]